jgi:hypothetical protein
MRMGFVVVYSIGGIKGIIGYGIVLACFLELGILSGPRALLFPRFLRHRSYFFFIKCVSYGSICFVSFF